ncbi:MAG: DoxX family protein [Bradymonadales bacterium]|nr:MAG: DoxX family protein [Bradymonadales bacterium]
MNSLLQDIGILVLRVWLGGTMLFAHGWGKLANFGERSQSFPDPLGFLGSGLSLSLAVFAEVFCAILVILGVLTRLASIPLVITMMVAFFIFHADDPFGRKELAFLFMGGFIALALTGGGRFAILKSKILPLS